MNEQAEIDFVHPINPWADLEARWAENERREHARWTDELRCIVWVCHGLEDWEWWNGQKNYERNAWLLRYLCAREEAILLNRPLVSPELVRAREEENYEQMLKLAQAWSIDLKRAFLEGKPCPIRAAPGWEHVLSWAMDLAQLKDGNFIPPSLPSVENPES